MGISLFLELVEGGEGELVEEGIFLMPEDGGTNRLVEKAARSALARLSRLSPNSPAAELDFWFRALPQGWKPTQSLAAPPF